MAGGAAVSLAAFSSVGILGQALAGAAGAAYGTALGSPLVDAAATGLDSVKRASQVTQHDAFVGAVESPVG